MYRDKNDYDLSLSNVSLVHQSHENDKQNSKELT